MFCVVIIEILVLFLAVSLFKVFKIIFRQRPLFYMKLTLTIYVVR